MDGCDRVLSDQVLLISLGLVWFDLASALGAIGAIPLLFGVEQRQASGQVLPVTLKDHTSH